ncbi:MAG TPA: hypothetical protein PLJ35_13820 [Anaerolineae bacterium]|nr:hypothetical protein [Anaerolineae bacterium]HOQ99892.1 hypothetical protein [Anaerolineae bacterium]HPL28079.1 hypothetical protein [Anaerolineae bacterium]
MASQPPQQLPPQAAELILQDERLTSDLEDAAADILLRWALSLAGQLMAAEEQGGQPLDDAAIADAVAPVRRVARQINDLVASRAVLEESEFLVRLLALIDAARELVRCP